MAYVCSCHGKTHLFDVALVCTDGTAMAYHVDTYADLVQSLVDISPSAGAGICGVAAVLNGRPCSDAFMARALWATGIARVMALAYGPVGYLDGEGFFIEGPRPAPEETHGKGNVSGYTATGPGGLAACEASITYDTGAAPAKNDPGVPS